MSRIPSPHDVLVHLPEVRVEDGMPSAQDETSPAALSAERRSRHRLMLLLACGVLLLAPLLHVRSDQRVAFDVLPNYPLPESCWSRSLLGVRCPGCGLTRSLVYLAHGDWQASLAMHRLGILMALAILAQVPYGAAGLLGKRDYPLGRRFATVAAWGLIVLLLGNWLLELLLRPFG